MGQYYHPIVLENVSNTPKFSWCSHDFHNGSKLMEHSYIGNTFMGAIEKFITDNPCRLVWAGDYADTLPNHNDTLYDMADDFGERITPTILNKTRKKSIDSLFKYLQNYSENKNRYIINHIKKQYVDKAKLPIEKNYGFVINPLSLLTCQSNGRGGGDYCGSNEKLVGSWCGDFISVSENIPDNSYTELIPNFMEQSCKYNIPNLVEVKVKTM
jgi:hypothetical protein